ncbi:hypothetical protein EJ05DRAFT_490508 [Pseudovirgaria hyperparasitica]|uniref:Uncharacterized protein n=1 Tax=Pseudovirgaria hyperparasitica TaxID=470096 RepID=A0A6A6VUP2_9PEZI|nr:uncharacterized protein EJ05DRAFT_490508 [Pseudovirgaria hyperparasitica]KAF2752977.1 hypothetical protein EJ05DRAFT_490508 [Pseudovirgaria hyperparasitica]
MGRGVEFGCTRPIGRKDVAELFAFAREEWLLQGNGTIVWDATRIHERLWNERGIEMHTSVGFVLSDGANHLTVGELLNVFADIECETACYDGFFVTARDCRPPNAKTMKTVSLKSTRLVPPKRSPTASLASSNHHGPGCSARDESSGHDSALNRFKKRISFITAECQMGACNARPSNAMTLRPPHPSDSKKHAHDAEQSGQEVCYFSLFCHGRREQGAHQLKVSHGFGTYLRAAVASLLRSVVTEFPDLVAESSACWEFVEIVGDRGLLDEVPGRMEGEIK